VNRPHHTDGDPEPSIDTVHLLSFDVEEYFQAEAASACVKREQWDSLPGRLGSPVGRILEMLAARGASATFFVLGWVAKRDPGLVRRICDAGHEIASHGMQHWMINRLSPEEFRADVRDSRSLLEDLAGRPVAGYRAPTFSVTHRTAWAIDVLADAGFLYDSSVFPVRHDRYGVPDAPRSIHRALGPAGGSLVEIPPLTARLAGMNWPVGGGGYLRLLPIGVLGRSLKAAERRGERGMIYLHPWELDPGQPVLEMGRLACWRHRVGLARTEAKLDWLLARFRFTGVRDCPGILTDPAMPTYRYGRQP
jgi:polysaccharide deacetylase family protein (PEP-CTERM system associated)